MAPRSPANSVAVTAAWASSKSYAVTLATNFLLVVAMVIIVLGDSVAEAQEDSIQCDFEAFPNGGCRDQTMTYCNITSNECVCNETLTIHRLKGHCFSSRGLGEICISSVQCSAIKATCVDATGEEVSSTKDGNYYYNENKLSGVCKCPDVRYFSQATRTCEPRILDNKCFFTKDCFTKIHATCENGKCRCKNDFFHDYLADECRPKLVTTLCMYGYHWDRETQKCRPSSNFSTNTYHSTDSSISALFWPAIAFFLVIFLLRLLKEGMKRDCERVSENNRARRHGHHRMMRPCAYGPGAHGGALSPTSLPPGVSRQSQEVIVLMPSALPPPYAAHSGGSDATMMIAPTDQPPSYEEATRTSSDNDDGTAAVVSAK